jgi:hypothetical protein
VFCRSRDWPNRCFRAGSYPTRLGWQSPTGCGASGRSVLRRRETSPMYPQGYVVERRHRTVIQHVVLPHALDTDQLLRPCLLPESRVRHEARDSWNLDGSRRRRTKAGNGATNGASVTSQAIADQLVVTGLLRFGELRASSVQDRALACPLPRP